MTTPQKLINLNIWQGNVTATPLAGGRSNEAYIASDDTGKYIVRFCHNEPVHHVMRPHEAMVSHAAAEAGFAPKLLHYAMNANNGENGFMVFEFITAKTYERQDVIDNLQRVVARLHGFHHEVAKKLTGPARLFNVFYVIQDYLATLAASTSQHKDSLEKYRAMAASLQQAQIPEHLVLGHNDIMPANILDDGKNIWFIDFEYAAFATPLSDLANLAANAALNPRQDEQLLQMYFGKQADAETLKAFTALKVALALRETMWSMVSEVHLNAPGVDYAQYTRECLEALDVEIELYQSKYGKLNP